MAQVVFHVGMGKTGSTTIQSALRRNAAGLEASGYSYMGQWLGYLRPEFDQFSGFQKFLRQPPEHFAASAEALLSVVGRIEAERGTHGFVVSNEQYLENIARLSDFFRRIAAQADLRVIIFVRPPASWLPSAYLQWGVVHKTNPGRVRPFAVKARELMGQYAFVQQWRELLGPAVTVLRYDETVDVVRAFSDALGLSLTSEPLRHQVRPPVAETLMRAACNTALPETVLPELFNAIRAQALPDGTPAALSQKFDQAFNLDALPDVLSEFSETLSYIEREFAIDLSAPLPEAPVYHPVQLADEIVGMLMSMVFSQAHEIRDLRARVEEMDQGPQRRQRWTRMEHFRAALRMSKDSPETP